MAGTSRTQMVAYASMQAVDLTAQAGDATSGGPVVLHNVSWEAYEAILAALGDEHPTLRLTYLEGTLEIMTTSRYHETIKTILARLIEMWAVERDVSLSGYGAATFRKRAAARGLEPDECYVVDPAPLPPDPREEDLPEVPDIAIEVVHKHLVDKLAVYSGLGVREVWTWDRGSRTGGSPTGRIVVHVLADGRYEVRESSAVLPDLDLAELARFVRPDVPQTELVKHYRDALRGKP